MLQHYGTQHLLGHWPAPSSRDPGVSPWVPSNPAKHLYVSRFAREPRGQSSINDCHLARLINSFTESLEELRGKICPEKSRGKQGRRANTDVLILASNLSLFSTGSAHPLEHPASCHPGSSEPLMGRAAGSPLSRRSSDCHAALCSGRAQL